MIRRFNYTNRQRIPREDITITLHHPENESPWFEGEIELGSDLKLPRDARIFIEAYRQALWMRFDYGSVEAPRPQSDTCLTRFRPGEHAYFRLKVVESNSETPRILAWADQIHPLSPEEKAAGQRSLLPVETADLGHRLWNLEWDDGDESPVLQLNEAFHEPRELTAIARGDTDFLALVYPEALRQILARFVLDPEYEPDDSNDWLRFGAKVLGAGPLPDRGPEFQRGSETYRDTENWLQRAVDGFCLRQNVVNLYATSKASNDS